MPRFFELKDLVRDPKHPGAYFQEFEHNLKNELCFRTFERWERALSFLDPLAWQALKSKASTYTLKHGPGTWQQLFDALGEAFAYNYLRKSEGCTDVCFIPESNDPTPDLKGTRDAVTILCEAKTCNISDDEVRARRNAQTVRKGASELNEGFFRKLDYHIHRAKDQLIRFDVDRTTVRIAFINVVFDDWSGTFNADYLQQIEAHLRNLNAGIEVVVSGEFSGHSIRVPAPHLGNHIPR